MIESFGFVVAGLAGLAAHIDAISVEQQDKASHCAALPNIYGLGRARFSHTASHHLTDCKSSYGNQGARPLALLVTCQPLSHGLVNAL
jgi:hypothetical protein